MTVVAPAQRVVALVCDLLEEIWGANIVADHVNGDGVLNGITAVREFFSDGGGLLHVLASQEAYRLYQAEGWVLDSDLRGPIGIDIFGWPNGLAAELIVDAHEQCGEHCTDFLSLDHATTIYNQYPDGAETSPDIQRFDLQLRRRLRRLS